MAKSKLCGEHSCNEPPYMDGLCRNHSDEAHEKSRRYMEAADVLHDGRIDGESIGPGPLREEFLRLQKWWREVCAAGIGHYEHKDLKDETRFGEVWCIAIAQEIIDVERDLRAGKPVDTETSKSRRELTWDRFHNLERGLMSNGKARPLSRR